SILRFVVKYTASNQGGVFLLNADQESDKHLELVACYALERKKYLSKRVTIGEGLVSQCFLEVERIYLLEVPQEYVSITAGQGGSNPNALLIVPLRVNESIFGVLELASFNAYEEYEIELVEKLAETIASTISSGRINESTRVLLEKTQQQAEEMRAQEEEMRQNMEELEATQEEMRRKEKHIQEMLEGEKKRNEFNNQNRQIVLTLSKAPEVLRGEWNNSLETITGAMGRQLQCSRTTIWRYKSGTETLVSEKTYLLDKGTYESDVEIQIGSYPLLIAELKAEKIIRASDVSADKITQGLVAEYFGPLGIQSMAAVPYFSDGKLAGYVAIENQYRQMEFNDDHLEFLQSCADIITVTI